MFRVLVNKYLLFTFVFTNMIFSGPALAITQSMTARISFESPLSINKTADVNFGAVKVGVADTYTLTTTGAVTASGSGEYFHGPSSAGSMTIVGSSTQPIGISIGDYTANGGVTLQNATCSYNGSAVGPCTLPTAAAPGSGKTLVLGMQAVVDGTQVAGLTATPGFTVTVVYQ